MNLKINELNSLLSKFLTPIFVIFIVLVYLARIYIHPQIWLLPFLLMLGLLFARLSSEPSILLPILTFIVFFQYGLYNTPYQRYLVIWDEILVFVFAGVIFLRKMTIGENFKKSPFDKYIVAFFFICVFSMVLNGSPILPGIMGIRNYLQYVLLFYCILNARITENTMKKVTNTIILVFLFQIPILIFQIFYALESGKKIGVDTIYGTLPGANNLSYASLFPIFLLLGKTDMKLDSLEKKSVFFLLLGILVVGQGRLAIILFPVILFWLYKKRLRSTSRAVEKVLSTVFVLLVLISSYFLVTKKSLHVMTRHYAGILDKSYLYPGTIWWKIAYYPITHNFLKEAGIIQQIVGFGPGMYGSFAGDKSQTPYTVVLSNILRQKERGVGPYVGSQIITIWGETGFAGLLVYLLLLREVFRYASRILKNASNSTVRILATGVIVGSFLMIVGSFFQQVFEIQVLAYPYWLLIALLIKSQEPSSKKT